MGLVKHIQVAYTLCTDILFGDDDDDAIREFTVKFLRSFNAADSTLVARTGLLRFKTHYLTLKIIRPNTG